ncbi:MAG: DUF5906 domain-containing protein, partial [Desulfobacterales bacterium]|nr:DUF5906 domain-containing protein [Desulfobacterales bacterium]
EFKERRSSLDFCNYNFTYIIPIKYNPGATCPEIDAIVQAILVDKDVSYQIDDEDDAAAAETYRQYLEMNNDEDISDAEEQEKNKFQKVDIFYDFLGSILMSDYRIKKAVVLLGSHDTGKTTLLNIAEQVSGTKNKCSVSIKDLDSNTNRFASSSLEDKLANIVDEMPRVTLKNIEQFKGTTGGKGFEGEKKGKDRHNIISRAKSLMAGNETPLIDGAVSHIFFKRLVIVECLNKFNPGNKETDINILYKKYTDDELSGLLNKAITGLERLLENGKYEYDDSENPGIWNKYVGSDNILKEFVNTCLDVTGNQNDAVSSRDMYNTYLEYHKIKKDGVVPMYINDFSEEMSTYQPHSIKARTIKDVKKSIAMNKRIQVKVWTGCKLLVEPRPNKKLTSIEMFNAILDNNRGLLQDLIQGNPTPENNKTVIDLMFMSKSGVSEDLVKQMITEYCQKVR